MDIIRLKTCIKIDWFYFVFYVIVILIYLGNQKKIFNKWNKGIATYHFKLEFWDLFQIPEIEKEPKYDNYDNATVLKRIYSLSEKYK